MRKKEPQRPLLLLSHLLPELSHWQNPNWTKHVAKVQSVSGGKREDLPTPTSLSVSLSHVILFRASEVTFDANFLLVG